MDPLATSRCWLWCWHECLKTRFHHQHRWAKTVCLGQRFLCLMTSFWLSLRLRWTLQRSLLQSNCLRTYRYRQRELVPRKQEYCWHLELLVFWALRTPTSHTLAKFRQKIKNRCLKTKKPPRRRRLSWTLPSVQGGVTGCDVGYMTGIYVAVEVNLAALQHFS